MPLPRTTAPFPESLLAAAAEAVGVDPAANPPVSTTTCDAHSNDRAEIRFSDGRTLVVKRARHAWAAERYAASRAAARLIRSTGIRAPDPVEVGRTDDGLPVEAYWWIDLPTLGGLWPSLPAPERGWALRHWGRLVARLHGILLEGHGSLVRGARATLGEYLVSDLAGRLLPAVRETWPEGKGLVETLLEEVDRVAGRADGAGVLVHNDLHMDNVLAERLEHTTRAVGVLDLEAAFAGPPEADLAHTEILHGPLFGRPLPAGWFAELLEGYGRAPDPVLLSYFRAFHLANFGYHAALCGWSGHANDVLRAAEREITALRAVGAAKAA